jgi:ribonucleoside-diphosphate reductase alpha chain
VTPGHKKGNNTHNISATISVKDGEWESVGEWMWKNRDSYNGLSVLPYDGGSYKQAPFEDCDELTYERMMNSLTDLDLTKIIEVDDNTNLSGEIACAGGACEVKYI